MAEESRRILVDASPGTSVGARPFAWGDGRAVTIIAKVSLDLSRQGPAALVEPEPVALLETPWNREPSVSIARADDVAIRKAACDITLVGSVVAPTGAPAGALTARLGVYRNGVALVDKTLVARGGLDVAGRPSLIRSAPLAWENALGGKSAPKQVADRNPVGTDRPWLVDPTDPSRPACFGPVSASWPCRSALLGSEHARALKAPVPPIDATFPWAYFQSAPSELQVPFLEGDEWLMLEGFHEQLGALRVRLPWLRARAFVASRAALTPVPLVIDTLAIDASTLRASVVFRGQATHLPPLHDVAIVAHVASGQDAPCPATAREAFERARPIPLAIPPTDEHREPAPEERSGAPFRIPAPAPHAPSRSALTPWQEVQGYVAPASSAQQTVALHAGLLVPPAPPSPPPALASAGSPFGAIRAPFPPVAPIGERPFDEHDEDELDRDPTPPPRAVVAANELRAAGLDEALVQRVIRNFEALPP